MKSQISVAIASVPQDIIESFCRDNQIHWLAIFGSAVGDAFHSGSDIDLLVEFESDAQIGFLDLSRMQRELTDIWGRPVDLVPRNGLKPIIRKQVLESARTLYAA